MGKKKEKPEVKEEVKEVKPVKVEKAETKLVTADVKLADKLINLGFHIESQKVVEGVLTYTFKEPKEKIDEAI